MAIYTCCPGTVAEAVPGQRCVSSAGRRANITVAGGILVGTGAARRSARASQKHGGIDVEESAKGDDLATDFPLARQDLREGGL